MATISLDANEIRNVIENDFRFIQGRDIKLLINRVGQKVGVAICQPNHELTPCDFKSEDDE